MAVMIQMHNSIQTDELSVSHCHLLVKGLDLLTGGILMLQTTAVTSNRCCIRINTLFWQLSALRWSTTQHTMIH